MLWYTIVCTVQYMVGFRYAKAEIKDLVWIREGGSGKIYPQKKKQSEVSCCQLLEFLFGWIDASYVVLKSFMVGEKWIYLD
jgi:hypothetical protein